VAKKNSGIPLTVAGIQVRVTHEHVPLGTIRLNPNNPRIRFQIERLNGANRPDEKGLLDLIRQQPGYDGLQKSIRKAGGLHDPIIIRHDGLVIEGNSRCTALKTLHAGNQGDARWKNVQVARLPKDVPEQAIAVLMAGFHVAGKTVWRPYAQADHIYQMHHKYKCSLEQIADETRMSKREVEQHMAAYEYLIKEVLPHVKKGTGMDMLESKWSHALEFIKRKNLAHLRESPQARTQFAKLIVQNKIQGQEVRQLDKMMKSKAAAKVLKKDGFKAANEVLKKADPTAGSKVLRDISNLTAALGKMGQGDLMLFKTNSKAQAALRALHKGVREVASFARFSLGTSNA
jgi:hypothetical protein